jgi:UDP-N-acetylglucosamine transferase subunit ALG13
MIFVAAGTGEFDSLIEKMDQLAVELSEPVVMQIGYGTYLPQNAEHFRFAPSLEPYYQQASLVVSHGGLGIITEVMNRGLPLVAVEDANQPDRHQREILTIWSQNKHLIWCQNLADLPQNLQTARQNLVPYQPPGCEIHKHIAAYLKF